MSTAIPYMAPVHRLDAFNCPYCGAYAHQHWSQAYFSSSQGGLILAGNFWFAQCERCGNHSVWNAETKVFPLATTAPLPNPDISDDIKADYNESRSISSLSPRGAAALLRLAIQKLCMQLGGKGQDLNADIADLVTKGLPATIQKALDVVRVIGNEAVHPGQIDLNDNPSTAQQLFGLVNLIAETMISQPKRVSELFEKLPDSKKEQIRKRDHA